MPVSLTAIKAALNFKHSAKSTGSSEKLPVLVGRTSCGPENISFRKTKTLIVHSSQHQFKDRDQTAIIFDFDDTLFPTNFLEHQSGLDINNPPDQQAHMVEDQLNDALMKIEECQASAESLLRCAQNFGRVIIVTLSSRNLLKKRCEAWYPRVWKMLNDLGITMVYAIEVHQAQLKPGQKKDHTDFSQGHWAWVKGKAIAKALESVYSQYQGQTWKNVISIGDSNFERYGTLGAANHYVQKNILRKNTPEGQAYVEGWQSFDSNQCPTNWGQGFEGVHEGKMFKVRTKVVKLMDAPSPIDLSQQLTLILDWFPSIVCLDDCLNHNFDNLNEETVKAFEVALGVSSDDKDLVESDM